MNDQSSGGTYRIDGEEVEYELHLRRADPEELNDDLPRHAYTDEFENEADREYYYCPRCGTRVHEWIDCIECGWYDEAKWEAAIERYEYGHESADDPEQTRLVTDGGETAGTSSTDTDHEGGDDA